MILLCHINDLLPSHIILLFYYRKIL